MSNEFNHIEAFEAYYNNSLPANSKIDFEERLESDSDFKNEYDLYLQLQEVIENVGDEQLKASLEIHHNNYIHSKQANNLKFKIYLGGFFLFLIAIGLLVLFFPEETAQQRINKHTAPVDVNPNIDPIAIKKHEKLKKEDALTLAPVRSPQKISNTATVTKNTLIKAPLKKYKTPPIPLYELTDSMLHLYGFNLKNEGYILSEQNNFYLITPNNAFLLEKSHLKKPLQKVNKRFYESAIKTKNQLRRATKLHQVILETATDSVSINFDKKRHKIVYSFDGNTLNISDSLNHQLQLISFENHVYLLNNENLFRLNQGDDQNLKPATQAEKNRLKSTTLELRILTETVEKSVEWENAN